MPQPFRASRREQLIEMCRHLLYITSCAPPASPPVRGPTSATLFTFNTKKTVVEGVEHSRKHPSCTFKKWFTLFATIIMGKNKKQVCLQNFIYMYLHQIQIRYIIHKNEFFIENFHFFSQTCLKRSFFVLSSIAQRGHFG